MESTDFMQVTTACDCPEQAERIAEALLAARVAACVHTFGPVRSRYWWQGKLETADEWLCIAKTSRNLWPWVEQVIRAHHSYEVPQIVATPLVAGSAEYLAWLDQTMKGEVP